VGKAALREGPHVVEPDEVGEGDRLGAVDDGDLGGRSREAVEEARPAQPGRPPLRIGIHREGADRLEGLDLLGVTTERKHDLRLLHHGVDPALTVGRRVRHSLETLERFVKICQGFRVCPPSLRFLGG